MAQLRLSSSDRVRSSVDMEDEALRRQLSDVVQQVRDDVRNPWYTLRPVDGAMPPDVVEEVVSVAMRRWRSRNRRAAGRRDPIRDLAAGLHAHFPEVIEDRQARDDWLFLARALGAVLQPNA
jgi:hypothetical protein